MKKDAPGRATSSLVMVVALALGCGAACSHSENPIHVGAFLVFDDNCDGKAVTWATVRTPDGYKPVVQLMSAGGCSSPIEYTPCKDMHCKSGNEASPFRQNVTMCTMDVAQAAVKSANGDSAVLIIDPLKDPNRYGCDKCTGVPPEGWAMVMFPTSDGRPTGCATAHCG